MVMVRLWLYGDFYLAYIHAMLLLKEQLSHTVTSYLDSRTLLTGYLCILEAEEWQQKGGGFSVRLVLIHLRFSKYK